jgi:hypothetical protein
MRCWKSRLLANIESAAEKLLSIILAGQPGSRAV